MGQTAMQIVLKLEELAMLILCVVSLYSQQCSWWCYLLLLIAPDISALGYLVSNRVGAFCYNLFHHKGVAIALFLVGYFIDNNIISITGVLIFGHASMDRFFGFGLKTKEGFKFTHLGKLGGGNKE
jgi:hypothetical protein